MSYQFFQQQTWTWNGHLFTIYSPDTTWGPVHGVYVFAGRNLWEWKALYVGQTDSFARRLPHHERWVDAVRMGATHIHIMRVGEEWRRHVIEQALIERYQPPLNTHHR